MLDTAPSAVMLRFDEMVTVIALRLVGPDGRTLPLKPPQVRDGVVRASVPPGVPGGSYFLSWRVTSADSHPVAGSIAFGVGLAGGTVPAGRMAMDIASIWAVPSQIARWLFYLALMPVAGGALFRVAVAEVPASVRRGLAGLALLGIVVAAAQVGLRGALLAGEGELWEAAVWHLGFATTLATSLLLSAAGLLGCAVTFLEDGPRWRALGILAGLLALAGFLFSGHVTTAEPRWLTVPALGLHTLAIAFWLGAFWPLLVLLRGLSPDSAAVRRFSRLAVPSVAVLIATGLVIAVVQVERPAALVGTAYGLLLLTKLAGVAGLIALATINRLRLTPALAVGNPGAAIRLRHSIGLEIVVAAMVLAATAALTLAVPPRVLGTTVHSPAGYEPEPAKDIIVRADADGLLARIEVVPGRVGLNRISITLDHAAGSAALARPPKEVWMELSQVAAGIGPIRRRLHAMDGRYTHAGPELAIAGRWRVHLQVLLTDFDQTTLATDIDIR